MEMGSVNKNMQSYPNQKDQTYYGPPYYPGMGAVPTHMYGNPAQPPMGHGYWPWGSSYGNASPLGCHGCCNHSYMPAHFAWGSPYSHVPPHHGPGNYPFPVHYMTPPPHYAMEQPRYEYEKNIPREHHCCGCPNHPIHQKEQKSLRIEEEEPQIERSKDGTLIPFQSKTTTYPTVWFPPDYFGRKEPMGDPRDGSRDVKAHKKDSPYPIVWLPPEYSHNKEQGKVESTGKDDSSGVKRHVNGEVSDQPPVLGNGWLPFDLNNLVSAKNRGNEKEKCQQDDGKQNFPFPLFWMPYMPDEKDSEKHMVKDASTTGLESESGSGGEKNFHVNRERVNQAASKARVIPVKDGGQEVEKGSSIKQVKGSDASVKESSDDVVSKAGNGEKVSAKEGAKRKFPSPPKSSKLPPVCLRVDPLPRRKKGNERAQSPSPASNKQKPESQCNDTSNVNSSENKEQAKIPHKEFKENKATKNIQVVDGRTSQGGTADVTIETPVKLPAVSPNDVSTSHMEKAKEVHSAQKDNESDAVIKGGSEDVGPAGRENEASSRAQEMEVDEVKKSPKRELSEEEAAVIIQSAYRGFEVRRWEPIKKLKQIAKVQDQIADVKLLIQEMKSSSDIQGRDKQRHIVAETIMSLLLKLDTIQGLHPSIREVRKSVVRELVTLQEQLDSLMKEKPENSQGEESMVTRDEDALNKSENVISFQSDNKTTPTDFLEVHGNQMNVGTNHEISEANLIGEVSEKIENEAAVSSNNVVDSAPEPTGQEEEKSNKDDNEINQPDLQAHQNQIDGGSKHDTAQVLEADQVVEEVSQKIEAEVSESSANIDSAPEPTIGNYKNSDEVLENHETISKEDHKDLVLEQGTEISSLQNDSFEKAADTVAIDSDVLGSELAELPVGIPDELRAQGDSNDLVVEVDASKADQAKQLEEALVESPIFAEPRETTDNKNSNQSLETGEILDLPHNGEPEFVGNCNSDDKPGSLEEAGSKSGGATIESDEFIAPHPQKFIEENNVARDMSGVEGAAETKSDNNRNDTGSGITEINRSGEASEELQAETTEESQPHVEEVADVPQQGEEFEVADVPQQGEEFDNSGEVSVEEHHQIPEDAQSQVVDVPDNGEEFNHSGEVPQQKQLQIPEDYQSHVDVPQRGGECNTKIGEGPEEQSSKDVTHEGATVDPTSFQNSPARVEVMESNQKLIEENERLREMIGNLLKSGQEQLTAISCLSGRVKNLEKKLSRRKKLKVKQYRAPKSGSHV